MDRAGTHGKNEGMTMQTIDQLSPVKRQVPLDGLYLGQRLKALAAEMGRSLVLTDYLTDKNGVGIGGWMRATKKEIPMWPL